MEVQAAAAAMVDLSFNRTPLRALLGFSILFAGPQQPRREEGSRGRSSRDRERGRKREESCEREKEKRLEKEVSALGITQSSKTWRAAVL